MAWISTFVAGMARDLMQVDGILDQLLVESMA